MQFKSIKSALVGVGALIASAAAQATPLSVTDILTEFNAVVSGNFTSTSDVEGRLVANNMTGGATFYNNPRGAASSYGAITANTIGNFNANVNNGGNVSYLTSDLAHFNLNGGGTVSQTSSFALSDFTSTLNTLSSTLSGLTSNSTVNAADPNNFTFSLSPDASGTAIFTLTTSQLAAARNILFSGSADTIIINVTGSSFAESGNFNASTYLNQHIIWNFVDATSLSFTSWHGAVLAGKATVSNSSAMEGFLYAANFNGNGELHDFGFAGSLSSILSTSSSTASTSNVPEPASAALVLGSLAALARTRRRK